MKAGLLRLLLIGGALVLLAFPATAAADNPPTATITSPSGGAVLSGNVTVTVDAADDVGVDHVIYRFFDGSNTTTLGTSSSAPFTFTFDSATLPNCGASACTLYAQAVDTAGQTSGGQFGNGIGVGVHNAIVVDTTADDNASTGCSLRNAIASANTDAAVAGCKSGLAGTPDTIEVPAGPYNLSASFGQLLISSNMNILGAGARQTDIRGYGTGQRVLEISSGNVTIGGVTIEGGSTTRGGNDDNPGVGGGIWIDSPGSLTLQDSTVSSNAADVSGGGIDTDGPLTVIGSTIENNTTGTSGFGAGIDDFGPSLTITNSTIMGNQAQADGGGLFLGGPSTLTNATIANNEANILGAGGSGGGIALSSGTTVDLTNTLLAGNTQFGAGNNCSTGIASLGNNLADDTSCGLDATGDQAGVDPQLGAVDTSGPTDVLPLSSGSPAIDAGADLACSKTDQRYVARPQGAGCDIGAYEFATAPTDYDVSTPDELAAALSSATSHGVAATVHVAAAHYDIGTLIGGASVGDNIRLAGAGAATAILDGDGSTNPVVDVGNGTTIEGVTVQNGGVYGINDNGSLVLKDSVVKDNASVGVESTNGGLDVSGSTISGNGDPASTFNTNNGGIYSEAPLTAVNTTITGNNGSGLEVNCCGAHLQNLTIAANPGIGVLFSDVADAVNTIVANNAGGDCMSAQGLLTSNGHNLDSDGSCLITPATGDLVNTDPQLGTLQDNGGPTPTMALVSGTPAVDAGDDANSPAVDQRGIARPQGAHSDIGAFELAAAPPTPTTIAFESNRFGSSEIFAMDADGSNVTQLTQDPSTTSDTGPSISPDGHTIVYQSAVGGVSQIWEMNGDGSNEHQLTSLGSNTHAAFSHDGTKIAFDSNRGGTSQLYLMNPDGTGQTALSTPGNTGGASWSPDDTEIAYNSDAGGAQQIYIVNVATGAVTGPLTTSGNNTNPHWSPDGSKILFVSDQCVQTSPTCGGGESVYVMNADGTNQQNLTKAPIFDADPAWSPDGSHIAFVRDLGGQNFNVFTANADGTNQVQLTFGTAPQRNSFPDWGTQVSASPTTTRASASLAADPSVDMSGSSDAIAEIPLSAFEVTASGVTAAPINGLPINGLPINGLPINGLPINGLPINGLPINGLPINGLPINGLPINGLPINGLELPGVDWESVLTGTPLADEPLQTITLQQVLDLSPQPPAVQDLTLGDLEVADSALGQITIGALVLGPTPINGLGLDTASLDALQAWCEGAVTSGVPATDCSLANIGNQSLFALGLAGAPINGLPINGLPINGLPINGLPINGLPINGLDLSASPINGLPINGLPINGLPINGLPAQLADVVDCSKVDCTTATLGEAAAAGAIVSGATYGQLLALLLADGSPVQSTLTLGDVIGLLIKRSDVPWETLSPRVLSVFDPSRPKLHLSAGFTLQGSGQPAADVKVQLPDGFDYDPGSATLTKGVGDPVSLAEPTIDGQTLEWQIPVVDPDVSYTIGFAGRSGTTAGPAQATETVTSGGQSDSSTAAFSVNDSYQGNDTAANAPTIAPNDAVQMSALPKPGAVDYYKVAMPPAGTRLLVHLADLPADYDLALYSSQTTSVRTGATSAPPLQDGTVPDQGINLDGTSNGQLTPSPLEDVPDPGIPVVQVSDNRGTDDEDVGMVSPGGTGFVTIAVFGYNGAFGRKPYTLRVTTQAASSAAACSARSFPHAGEGTTPDALPADLSSLPADLNTIILVDEKRLGDTYGAGTATTGEQGALAALHRLAGDASLGVSGVVVPVEKVSGVQGLYDTWDQNPCNPEAANAVANAIADEVLAIKTARPSVRYVVFGGGDDQIPFFRIPDLTRIANESGFASQFGANEYRGSLAAGDLLTDNPYLDTRPIPASGRQLFIPDLVGGRLVETADDITSAVSSFEGSTGTLRSSTGFVSGYDFVADGSHQVANRLASLGVNVQTLVDDTTPFVPTMSWSKSTLLADAFPSGGPAAINDWNGHYDNTRAQMANGDLLTTSELTGSNALNGGIFFTMGCHAGFQTTDAIIGSSVLDWPQYFASAHTGFVGNTGFGLGSTDSIAFSEELMSDFAANLGGSLTLGQALTQAKDQYFLSRVAFSSYDEKTLSEAELYGLPMYGVGHAPSALAPLASPSPDPVSGTSASTSPSQGSLNSFPGTGVQSAGFAATPSFTHVGPPQTQDGEYFTNAGHVQAPNYRPLQPYVSLPASRGGLVAHGVVIDDLTSEDHTPFDPDNVRPTLDLSANEPEPQFTDEAWPEKIPTLASLGSDQSLNLITGQFFTEASGSTTTGVERLWTQIDGRVTYSSSSDFTPPTVDSIGAFLSNGVVAFTGRFSDVDQSGTPGSGNVAFAQVVYDDGTANWKAVPLQPNAGSGTWSGGTPFGGSHIQYFVEVCDAAGNCGYSSNKGSYFDAQPLPSGTGGALTITPNRAPDTGSWYTASLDVTASSGAPTVSVSVDGGTFSDSSATVGLSGDGVHIVEARDSDGNTATAAYLIDTTGPKVTPSISAPDGTNGWYKTKPTVTFKCADNLSGVNSCLADGSTTSSTTIGEGASQGATATATDNAGNTGHGSISGLEVDVTAPTKPTFTGGISAQLYPVSNLPAATAIGCTADDALSGFDHCVVTGYSATYGAHTLTATAYDTAGNANTNTLTYVVGLQAGNILAPVTAKSGDQTNQSATDLQVFKIKSTVPVKFQFYLDSAKTTLMTTPPAGSIARLTVAKADSSTDSIDATTLVTGSADTGNQFRWTGATDYQYVYNMSTSGLAAGTYSAVITLYAADGTTVLGQSAKQYFVLRS